MRALRKRRWDDGPGEVQPTGEVQAALPSSKRFMVQARVCKTVVSLVGFRPNGEKVGEKGGLEFVFLMREMAWCKRERGDRMKIT